MHPLDHVCMFSTANQNVIVIKRKSGQFSQQYKQVVPGTQLQMKEKKAGVWSTDEINSYFCKALMCLFLLHLSYIRQTLQENHTLYGTKLSFIQNHIKASAPDLDVVPQFKRSMSTNYETFSLSSVHTCFTFSKPNAIVSKLIDSPSICPFSKLLILFRTVRGWILSQHALGRKEGCKMDRPLPVDKRQNRSNISVLNWTEINSSRLLIADKVPQLSVRWHRHLSKLQPKSWSATTWPTGECDITSVVFIQISIQDCESTRWAGLTPTGIETPPNQPWQSNSSTHLASAALWMPGSGVQFPPGAHTRAALKTLALKALWMKALSKWQL